MRPSQPSIVAAAHLDALGTHAARGWRGPVASTGVPAGATGKNLRRLALPKGAHFKCWWAYGRVCHASLCCPILCLVWNELSRCCGFVVWVTARALPALKRSFGRSLGDIAWCSTVHRRGHNCCPKSSCSCSVNAYNDFKCLCKTVLKTGSIKARLHGQSPSTHSQLDVLHRSTLYAQEIS